MDAWYTHLTPLLPSAASLTDVRCTSCSDEGWKVEEFLSAAGRLSVLRLPSGAPVPFSHFCASVLRASERKEAEEGMAWRELGIHLRGETYAGDTLLPATPSALTALEGRFPSLSSLELTLAAGDIGILNWLLPHLPALRFLSLSIVANPDMEREGSESECECERHVRCCLTTLVARVTSHLGSEAGRRLTSLRFSVADDAVTDPSDCPGFRRELVAIEEALVKDGGSGSRPVALSALRCLSLVFPQASDFSREMVGRLGQAGITAEILYLGGC